MIYLKNQQPAFKTLVLEREAAEQEHLMALFRGSRFEIEITDSAAYTQATLTNSRREVLFVGQETGSISDLDLLREIRHKEARERGDTLFIAFMTSGKPETIREQALTAGANVVVEKPLRRKTLEEVTRLVARHWQWPT